VRAGVHEREFVNRYSEHVARLATLFHFFETYQLADDGRSDRLEIPEPTVKAAIEICEWYLNEFGRIFNPDMAIEEAAQYALKKLKERLASKNGGQVPEVATLGNQNIEMPENELRLFCSRYGLKTDSAKFKMALDWLEERRLVLRYPKHNGATRRSTDIIQLVIKMRHWRDTR